MSLSDLTPPPERVRPRLRQTLLWILLIAVGLTVARWYYAEQIVPNQPIRFRDFDAQRYDRLLRSERKVMVFVTSAQTEENAPLSEIINSPRIRKLLHRMGYVSMRLPAPDNEESTEQFLAEWELVDVPAIVFPAGDSSIARRFVGTDAEEEAIYSYLRDLRFGKDSEL